MRVLSQMTSRYCFFFLVLLTASVLVLLNYRACTSSSLSYILSLTLELSYREVVRCNSESTGGERAIDKGVFGFAI